MQFQIKDVKLLRKCLKKVIKVTEIVAIKFQEDGIKIFGMDEKNVTAIQLFISKEHLGRYEYEPINNIGINAKSWLTVLSRLTGNVTIELKENLIKMSSTESNRRKQFCFSILQLDNSDFPEFKRKIEWNISKKINGFCKAFLTENKGPLVIESAEDGYSMRWIVAPSY